MQWTGFVQDEHGKAIGVCRFECKYFSSKQLRTIRSRLSLKGVKNAKKFDMVERLVGVYEKRQAYNALRDRHVFASGFNVNAGAITGRSYALFGSLSMLNMRQHSPALLHQELMTAVSTISAMENLMFIS